MTLKRRGPLRRTTPLARKTRIPRKRDTPRRSHRVRDATYLAWVRAQPCAMGARLWRALRTLAFDPVIGCAGPIDPDHDRYQVGIGQKADDRRAYPICRRHHDDLHALRGLFSGWTGDQVRAWRARCIAASQAAYAATLGVGSRP